MPDFLAFEKQDLINLQKVAIIDKSDSASYQDADGTIKSMYQRRETGYRIQFADDLDTVWLFVFNQKNKLVSSTKYDVHDLSFRNAIFYSGRKNKFGRKTIRWALLKLYRLL